MNSTEIFRFILMIILLYQNSGFQIISIPILEEKELVHENFDILFMAETKFCTLKIIFLYNLLSFSCEIFK